MKEITQQEIREIAENIVSKANESSDAIEDISAILGDLLTKMDVAVEKVKKNPDCKCKNCECDK